LAFGILIIPLFDLVRVFALRLSNGKSPFIADKSHSHHQLISLGLTHLEATAILSLINIFFIIVVYFFNNIGISYLMGIIVTIAVILSLLLSYLLKRKNSND
jgi:hypothetical protein